MDFRNKKYLVFVIPRKRPNERSECDMEQSTYKYCNMKIATPRYKKQYIIYFLNVFLINCEFNKVFDLHPFF